MRTLGSERYHFVQMTPAIRRRLEATLDNLIHLLDAIDGDADAEPTLGAKLRSVRIRASRPGLAQPNPRPAPVLGDEFHAGGFQRLADRVDRARLQFLAGFEAHYRVVG